MSQINIVTNTDSGGSGLSQFFVAFLVFVIGTGIFGFYVFYWLEAKLRYFWFLFLDNYGKADFSFSNLMKQMKELNEVNKYDAFKKSLLSEMGVDTISEATSFTSSVVFSKIGKWSGSPIGNAGAEIASGYVHALTTELGIYAKLVVSYILYRHSRNYLYNKPQVTNENVYLLENI